MGSGCLNITKNSSPCATTVSSNCVLYQGDPVPLLGICTGDTITEVESTIINRLLLLLNGTGITLPLVTLDNCAYLKTMFGSKDKTITNLMQLLVDSECNLKSLIDVLYTRTAPSNFVFNLKCLPPITNPTQELIIQSIINELCNLETTVSNIIANSGNTTIINTQINSALSNLITSNGNTGLTKTTDTNGLSHYNIKGFCPPGSYIPYGGPISAFDASGKGITGTSTDGWYLCNGNNGTIDMRGFVPVGAIQGVPGPALDPLVDPVANADATMNYALGSKGGKASVKLSQADLPNYNITSASFNVAGSVSVWQKRSRHQAPGSSSVTTYGPDATGTDPTQVDIPFTSTNGNVTVPLNGGGGNHENRMPYRVLNWITRFD